jgi:hypothetical protein
MGDTLPRQVYLNLLLRLPAMYFTRVARIFEDAEVSRPDIERMINARGGGGAYMLPSTSETVHANAGMAESSQGREPGMILSHSTTAAAHAAHVGMAAAAVPFPLPFPDDWSPPNVSPALIRFKHSWEAFIDSLLREWKTLNVVSALLLSCVFFVASLVPHDQEELTNLMQCYTYYVSDSKCRRRSSHKDCCTAFAGMCFDEFILWVYVYREIWDDEKYVSSFEMGSGKNHNL